MTYQGLPHPVPAEKASGFLTSCSQSRKTAATTVRRSIARSSSPSSTASTPHRASPFRDSTQARTSISARKKISRFEIGPAVAEHFNAGKKSGYFLSRTDRRRFRMSKPNSEAGLSDFLQAPSPPTWRRRGSDGRSVLRIEAADEDHASQARPAEVTILGRTVARHLPNRLPGNPQILAQNMPGAGGMVATNFLYNIAPKDGATIGIIDRGIPTAEILYGKNSKSLFDATSSTGSAASPRKSASASFPRTPPQRAWRT